MNTVHRTHRIGLALVLLIGGAPAVGPIAAHATSLEAPDPRGSLTARQSSTSGTDTPPKPTLRQLIEADRFTAPELVVPPAAPENLRQLLEADRPSRTPEPAVPSQPGNLRQLMEADRAEPTPRPDGNLRQLMEADRPIIVPRLGAIGR